jgi:hypothetical protein
LASAGQVIELG